MRNRLSAGAKYPNVFMLTMLGRMSPWSRTAFMKSDQASVSLYVIFRLGMSMSDQLSMMRRLSTMVLPLPTLALPDMRWQTNPLFSLNDNLSQFPDITPPFSLKFLPFSLMSSTSRSNQFISSLAYCVASLRKFLILNAMPSSSTSEMEKISLSFFFFSLLPLPSRKILFRLMVPEVSAAVLSPGSMTRKKSPSVTFAVERLMLPSFINVFMPNVAETYLARKSVSVVIMPAESL